MFELSETSTRMRNISGRYRMSLMDIQNAVYYVFSSRIYLVHRDKSKRTKNLAEIINNEDVMQIRHYNISYKDYPVLIILSRFFFLGLPSDKFVKESKKKVVCINSKKTQCIICWQQIQSKLRAMKEMRAKVLNIWVIQ